MSDALVCTVRPVTFHAYVVAFIASKRAELGTVTLEMTKKLSMDKAFYDAIFIKLHNFVKNAQKNRIKDLRMLLRGNALNGPLLPQFGPAGTNTMSLQELSGSFLFHQAVQLRYLSSAGTLPQQIVDMQSSLVNCLSFPSLALVFVAGVTFHSEDDINDALTFLLATIPVADLMTIPLHGVTAAAAPARDPAASAAAAGAATPTAEGAVVNAC